MNMDPRVREVADQLVAQLDGSPHPMGIIIAILIETLARLIARSSCPSCLQPNVNHIGLALAKGVFYHRTQGLGHERWPDDCPNQAPAPNVDGCGHA